ncbi:LLM class flavin-dependent oxidoreductase [Bacillus sp. B15-48]|uniref:LLM class flavin-dependent oxidoreductase n=1 Tax=Bacillus sp. B15-48 TaxID=1548601 RepID=UPI00193EC2A2|nr:LLM class flavin-dependent oxidoreductase [Bacillus sp. B15-48]MBM4764771.1 NtaA/DmoA family FMN-dependent monooxygenase [Bacillus sp. B15-48]
MKKIHFASFVQHSPNNQYPIVWRHPRTRRGFEWNRPEIFEEIAAISERGKFDMMFAADTLGIGTTHGGSIASSVKNGFIGPIHDSFTLMALLAGKTKHIGLGATMSTSFYPPYLLARMTATLDHLSRGRFAWNVVTSSSDAEAQNFGLDKMYSHAERYERADEFLELCYQLWESWEEDAVLEDRENGIFADPSKVKHINFSGKYFKSKGPLNVTRSPQGRPAIIQAGSSDSGKDLAAKHAEVIFALLPNIDTMKAFYDDVKGRMIKFGRNPDDAKILFGVQPIVGETEEIAHIKRQIVASYGTAEIGLMILSTGLGIDFSKFDLDQPLSQDLQTEGLTSTLKMFNKSDTLRDAAKHMASTGALSMVGTGEQVAEEMETAMREIGGDGFMIQSAFWPSALTEFVEMVIPILQDKGLHRKEYTGKTLKDHILEY